MPIGTNRMYNDPALGQAFSNLAQIFAPPSGSDLAGYATAAAKKEEAARLAELFRVAQDPATSFDVLDRLGIGAGVFAPSQSLEAVNRNNATQRYGYDQQLAGTKYSADTQAAASRANNVLDSQRQTITSLYGTLAPGEVRPAVPAELMGTLGLPAVGAVAGAPKPLSESEVKGAILQGLTPEEKRAIGLAEGAVTLNPGQVARMPDGSTLEGAPKPVTEDELKAAVFGQLSPDQQRAVVFGSTPVEQVVTEDGVRNVTRLDAIGQQPFIQQGSEAKPTNAVARLPDGRNVPAIQDTGTGRWRHAQTGEELPADIEIFDPPKATGSAADVGMGTTANQTQANAIRAAVQNSDMLVRELDTLVRKNPAATGLAGDLIGFTQDLKQVFAEFGAKFGDDPNALVSPSDLAGIADRVIPTDPAYSPVYRQARAMLLELAYSNARMNNPSGEVSRFALEREIEALGQGMVGNDQGLLATLDVARARMKRKLAEADVLDGRAAAPTPDTLYTPPPPAGGASAGPVPPAPPGPPSPPAPPGTVRRYNPQTGRIE